MVRIAISQAAFEAIAATLLLGSISLPSGAGEPTLLSARARLIPDMPDFSVPASRACP